MEVDAGQSPVPGDREVTDLRLCLISRELHDEIGGAIASVLNLLELHELYWQNQNIRSARAKISDAKRALHRALRLTKELAVSLRVTSHPSSAAADSERSDAEAVRMALSTSSAMQRIEEDDIFAILREAVRNAIRHSGAERITVQLTNSGSDLIASVEDDGSGLSSLDYNSPSSLGLFSMRERAALLGGVFQLDRGPSGGTRIKITVPLDQAPH